MGDRTDEDNLRSILSDHLRHLRVAKTLESDHDMAFNLQLQEAMAASLALRPPSTSPQTLHPRIHDHNFVIDLTDWPEAYCTNDASSSSKAAEEESECFRLYFKGLVSEERVKDMDVIVAGVGVAVCDARDNRILEAKKNLEAFGGGEVLSNEAAELEALIEGLSTALTLDLRNVTFFCDNNKLYQYVTYKVHPENFKIATLVTQVALLQRKFEHCTPSLVEPSAIKFAFQFAREAIVSQITWTASNGKRFNETCVICFEETDVTRMFSIEGCLHKYCCNCMKQHIEAKLLNGSMVHCPHEGCESEVSIDSCETFLEPKLVQVMRQRIKESSIPVTEKVYCPDPKCSALMSKNDVLENTKNYFVAVEQSGVRLCMECHRCFCINCKVPFDNHTCYDYKKSNPSAEEQLVKSLAKKKHWRQCVNCSHMVELAEGCYHITCRCGYEFCYTCGAEWKDKTPTCSCPIWDERNIIRE
ncbi:putative transcription factor C2H2 family [Rosa chinensis]|uniref:RBR-type E3 ubiquitin transferase n=1 Tax=Rosa chinensis TaxID=74649 RepID=A0A2P6QHR9_ROSCH|nr:uncharacterized protein LOC112166926 [Rosa chinensis]PRQ33725.1 putative transcription factor C2H2 family [Rosa chinensis]